MSNSNEMEVVSDMPEIVTVDIINCSRCGEDHSDLTFKKLTCPIIVSEGERWTHWASCPSTREPIIMKIGI